MLYDEPARQAGGIWAEDRHGVKRFFACTTLAIGALRIQPGRLRRAEEVANLAAMAKHDAKLAPRGIAVHETCAAHEACAKNETCSKPAGRHEAAGLAVRGAEVS